MRIALHTSVLNLTVHVTSYLAVSGWMDGWFGGCWDGWMIGWFDGRLVGYMSGWRNI
jgi:hypothetical protein